MAERTLQNLNLIDNFFFFTVVDHERCGKVVVRTILETVLQREVRIGKITSEKVLISHAPGRHGIRMDAFIQEDAVNISGGDVFDLEPENKVSEKAVLPKRARYYQSRMDNKTLQSGEGYGALREAWVIFITSFDPFGEGRMVYTVRRRCVEVPALEYEDGAWTLFLYVDGEPGDTPRELQELLHYIARTTPENACNAKLREIQGYVDELKQDPEVKESFMSFEDYLMAERREAVMEVEAERDAQAERAAAAEAERDAQKERAKIQTERAEIAEAQRDLLSMEIEKLRNELARLQKPVQ
jgi:predicted transposase/invertase (TIGR01784 family)